MKLNSLLTTLAEVFKECHLGIKTIQEVNREVDFLNEQAQELTGEEYAQFLLCVYILRLSSVKVKKEENHESEKIS